MKIVFREPQVTLERKACSLSRRIRVEVLAHGLNAVARKSDFAPVTVSKWIHGHCTLPASSCLRICHAAGEEAAKVLLDALAHEGWTPPQEAKP